MNDKNVIREIVGPRIEELPLQEKVMQSMDVCEALKSHPKILEARLVLVYKVLSDEIDISEFTDWLSKQGKQVGMPNYHTGIAQTQKELMLDIESQEELDCTGDNVVVIVPGRAFTAQGIRTGRGGGWYDRFLSWHLDAYTIGVGFRCQIFDQLPSDEWDQQMDEVIYSKGA